MLLGLLGRPWNVYCVKGEILACQLSVSIICRTVTRCQSELEAHRLVAAEPTLQQMVQALFNGNLFFYFFFILALCFNGLQWKKLKISVF